MMKIWGGMKTKTVRGTLAATLALALVFGAPAQAANAATVNGEQLDFANKMSPGTNIGYKIFAGNEYTSSIPAAVNMLMYPSGLSNPMVLWSTTATANSQMDFYQYSDSLSGVAAYATVWEKDPNGPPSNPGYRKMPTIAMDWRDWRYAEIRLNDAEMDSMSATTRKKIILHEMLHGYGLRDLVKAANKPRIMT